MDLDATVSGISSANYTTLSTEVTETTTELEQHHINSCFTGDIDPSMEATCNEDTPEPEPEEKPEELPALLPPDHPLLERFQIMLKDYLERSKAKLSLEIDEMKYQLKQKEKERIERGSKLYDLQQELHHQNDQLEEFGIEMQNHYAKRKKEEDIAKKLKDEYESKLIMTKDKKQFYNKRMVELEHLQLLENNIHNWADEVEDEVKNAKRIVSRDAQLQKQLSEEKKKSDMVFFHLDSEVNKREKELVTINEELADMKDHLDVINMSISNANADLEALQNEHKRLTQVWMEVIVAIQHRDKILFQLRKDLDKEKESIKLSNSNMEAIKKQLGREMKQNEKLEQFKVRIQNDFNALRRDCIKEMAKMTGLENKLEEIPIWLKQTNKDWDEAKKEGNTLEIEVRRIQFKIDKMYNRKFQIEENILKMAQDQLVNDKASEYRLKLLNTAQDKRRNYDLSLAQSQNKLTMALFEMEQKKGILFKYRHDNEKLDRKLTAIETEANQLQSELYSMNTQIDLKLKKIEQLTNKLDEVIRTSQGMDASPTERKIKLLEKAMAAAEQQIREHQQFWIMLQNHFVNLTQKRTNQLNAIQVTRKELSIIKQKSLKIDCDLELCENTTRELNRDVKVYTSRIELLNQKIYKKRQKHQSDENECEMEHSHLLQNLKDQEMAVLETEEEINELQTEIDHYKDIVLDKHREALSWETKYKLIEETLRWRKDEQGLQSEIGTMKSEIHRMQIRYTQLRQAQEKLIQDLEHCIMHREQIFTSSSIKQTMESKRSKTQASTQQKVFELRNKLKNLNSEISTKSDDQFAEMGKEHDVLNTEILKLKKEMDEEVAIHQKLNKEIEEAVLAKFQNLDIIVRKQNRAKAYKRLSQVTMTPRLPRTESTIILQKQKQTEMNDNLAEILQKLATEFKDRSNIFTKMLGHLKMAEN